MKNPPEGYTALPDAEAGAIERELRANGLNAEVAHRLAYQITRHTRRLDALEARMRDLQAQVRTLRALALAARKEPEQPT